MAATFLADHLKVTVSAPDTISQRLRKLFAAADKGMVPRHTLLKAVGEELTAFTGGAPQPTHNSREYEEVSSELGARTHTPGEEGTVYDPFLEDTPLVHLLTRVSQCESPITVPEPNEVGKLVQLNMRRCAERAPAAHKRKIGYFLVALALANVADGGHRSMSSIETVRKADAANDRQGTTGGDGWGPE